MKNSRLTGTEAADHTAHDQPNVEALEKSELVDLQVTKHFYEREMLIHILLGKDARDSIDKACKLKPDERKVLLKSLQSQHKNWKLNPQADPAIYKSILLQALGLKWEERKAELESGGVVKLSQEELREILFADLQQKQGGDFEGVLQELQNMTTRQLVIAVGRQCEARIAEHFDNIASVLLGTIEISEEDEEYIKALEHKYDILRKRIFLMALKDKLDWKNLSKEEKQSALRDIMKQEKKLRSEGKLQEMGDLLGLKARANTLPALRSLIGEDKAEYSRRKMAGKHEEIPVDETEVVNILADLVPRQDREQEFLLSWLHSPEGKGLIMRMKRMRIVEIKVEGCRLEMEDEFEIATLSTGLMERVKDTLTSRHESDNERQSELARRRVRQRRLRLQQNEEYRQDPTIAKDNVPHAAHKQAIFGMLEAKALVSKIDLAILTAGLSAVLQVAYLQAYRWSICRPTGGLSAGLQLVYLQAYRWFICMPTGLQVVYLQAYRWSICRHTGGLSAVLQVVYLQAYRWSICRPTGGLSAGLQVVYLQAYRWFICRPTGGLSAGLQVVYQQAYRWSICRPTGGLSAGLQVVYLQEMFEHHGDITGLQNSQSLAFHFGSLQRHCDERETLLNHLQDESLEDVVEAAATMDDSERQRRLAELQAKRQNLNLTMPGMSMKITYTCYSFRFLLNALEKVLD
ncbi:hypothetical protein DPMN_016286 [Dreissena polymorpha]|uniref:Uncharacterized protein n=1 Tax=Dreissena polymorpha TaxID=45954 RepID=A0A9D4NEI3_DREPO|nr:hypothetical protein DPMN_016286 [Dreissena polymorpha]